METNFINRSLFSNVCRHTVIFQRVKITPELELTEHSGVTLFEVITIPKKSYLFLQCS